MNHETEARLTRAVRQADSLIEESGDAGTRHWIRELFLPALEREGLEIVEARPDEWSVSAIGGGESGLTREQARDWLAGWHETHGEAFDATIEVRRRRPAGEWLPATREDVGW